MAEIPQPDPNQAVGLDVPSLRQHVLLPPEPGKQTEFAPMPFVSEDATYSGVDLQESPIVAELSAGDNRFVIFKSRTEPEQYSLATTMNKGINPETGKFDMVPAAVLRLEKGVPFSLGRTHLKEINADLHVNDTLSRRQATIEVGEDGLIRISQEGKINGTHVFFGVPDDGLEDEAIMLRRESGNLRGTMITSSHAPKIKPDGNWMNQPHIVARVAEQNTTDTGRSGMVSFASGEDSDVDAALDIDDGGLSSSAISRAELNKLRSTMAKQPETVGGSQDIVPFVENTADAERLTELEQAYAKLGNTGAEILRKLMGAEDPRLKVATTHDGKTQLSTDWIQLTNGDALARNILNQIRADRRMGIGSKKAAFKIREAHLSTHPKTGAAVMDHLKLDVSDVEHHGNHEFMGAIGNNHFEIEIYINPQTGKPNARALNHPRGGTMPANERDFGFNNRLKETQAVMDAVNLSIQ